MADIPQFELDKYISDDPFKLPEGVPEMDDATAESLLEKGKNIINALKVAAMNYKIISTAAKTFRSYVTAREEVRYSREFDNKMRLIYDEKINQLDAKLQVEQQKTANILSKIGGSNALPASAQPAINVAAEVVPSKTAKAAEKVAKRLKGKA